MSKKPLVALLVLAWMFACTGVLLAQEGNAGKTITAVEVQGNKSISSNTILSKLRTRVGVPYQDNVTSDDLKRLYLLGFFSDIKIKTEDYKQGVKIIIVVAERPIIDKIIFSGFKKATAQQKQLRDTIKSKEGQYLDYPTMTEDVETLVKMYEKKGYGQAKVEYTVDVDQATNKAAVNFTIEQNKRQRIRMIYVEGNINFSDARIRKLIKTKRSWFFGSGILKEEVLTEDMERIKEFYHRRGFIDANARFETTVDPLGKFIYITITVEEGKKYLVGSLLVRGNKDIAEPDILAKIKAIGPGKTFSNEALKDDIAAIHALYFDRGYIMAQVQEATALNQDTGRIDVVLTITENQVVYVDQIKIRGNIKTKDLVVRREMRIKPGERFDGDKLRRSKERLQNLGYFEEISYETEDTLDPAKKDLVVDVKETKTGAFSFGGGFSSVDGLVGFVEVEQKNFDIFNFPYFTGAGQNMKLRAALGSMTESVDLSFTEPWLFDYPVSFGFDLYKTDHERDQDVGYGYDESVMGGDIRLGKELSEYWRGDVTYRNDKIKIGDVTETASQDLKDEAGTNYVSSFTFGLLMDSRDNVFTPLRGNVFSNSITAAGGPLGGDKDFWKYSGRYEHYVPLPHESVIEMRTNVALADPYSDTNKIPIYERFFAGGANTIRGYRERSIGPQDPISGDPLGGDSLAIANIEYLYPVAKFLRVGVFYDIGNVWKEANDLATGGYKAGTGLGLRIKTPIGPVLFYYGIPLNKESGESKRGNGRFSFSMGYGL